MGTVKTDCFAYYEATVGNSTRRKCLALNELYCRKEECKFYKSVDTVCKNCQFTDCKGCVVAEMQK